MTRQSLLLILIITTGIASAASDPNILSPTNAAYWYEKAFEQMLLSAEITKSPTEFNGLDTVQNHRDYLRARGIPYICPYKLDDPTKEYIKNNLHIADLYIKASKCNFCDWGFSNVDDLPKAKYKMLQQKNSLFLHGVSILLASSIINAESENYSQAIKEYSSAQNTFLNDDIFETISIPVTYRKLTRTARQLLPLLSKDQGSLKKLNLLLKDQLKSRPSIQERFDLQTEYNIIAIKQDKFNWIKRAYSEGATGKVDVGHYKQFRNQARKLCYLPCKNALPELEKFKREYYLQSCDIKYKKENKISFDINKALLKAYDRFNTNYFFESALRVEENVNYIASEVYCYYVINKKLPETLPKKMPKNPMDGEDFLLIKTEKGFKLQYTLVDIYTQELEEVEFPVLTL